MSNDRFTEVTSQSWFGRIGGAIKGVIIGLILFAVAFPLLFWNEGRAVKRYKTLKEGGGAVVSVTSESVDASHADKLVHVTGKAVTDATLKDADFGVSAQALKLKRSVEMYQWDERTQSKTNKKLGGGTETVKTFTYEKKWSGSLNSSANFKEPSGHQNPGAFPYEPSQQVADKVTLGAFRLSPSLVGMISNFEPLPIGSDSLQPEPLNNKAKLQGNGFYIGSDSANPQVGDTRVKFEVARPADVSVIAKQTGDTFAPYETKAGGSIELLQMGIQSSASMIQKAQESNALLTWILRLVGVVLMLIGLNLIFKPLSVLADVVPIFGSIVGFGTGLLALLLSSILSLLTIAIAWIVYRPLLGIILLIVAVGLAVLASGKFKSARNPQESSDGARSGQI